MIAPMDQPCRILYVEDDLRMHRLVPALTRPSSFVWICVATASEAVRAFQSEQPQLVLVDLGLPDRDGVDLIEELAGSAPGLPILVLSIASTEARIMAALRAGACGYLLKEDLGVRLPDALREALSGGVPLSRAVARTLLGNVRKQEGGARLASTPAPAPSEQLSSREREVVEQLSYGLTYEEVARELGMSINTVRTHVRAIYDKLGVGSKTEAVLLALERGLLTHG